MAQIPMGPFDAPRVLPQTQTRVADTSPLMQHGRGAAAIADALGDVTSRGMQLEQQRIAREKSEAEQLARAKAANAMLDDEIQQRAKVQEITQKVATGELPYEKAQEEFQTWHSLREPPKVDGLDPVGQEHLQGSLTRNRFQANNELDGVVKTARRADGIGQRDGIWDKLGKIGSDPASDLNKVLAQGASVRPLVESYGLSATFEKDYQNWADRTSANHARARFVAARDTPDGLTALEHDLTAEDGLYAGKLDAEKKTAVLSLIQTRRAQLEAKTQHDADKAETAAERALTQLEQFNGRPAPPPLEKLDDWSNAVKNGTPEQQERFRELIKGQAEIRTVLQKSPAEQAAFVQAERARQTREGATLQQQANLERIEKAVEEGAKQLRESPLEYFSARTGTEVRPLDLQAISQGDIAPLQRQIAERINTIETMRKQLGPGAGVGRAPLLPQEAQALSTIVQKLPPDQLTGVFGRIRQVFGDDRTYLAALGQISKDAPVRAQAGALATWNPRAAQLVLKGAAILEKTGDGKAFAMPSDKQVQDEFGALVGEAFRDRPDAYAQALQVARAAYAGAAATDGDVSGELDATRLRNAVHATVGQPVRFNGADVLAPPGMDEDLFQRQVERAWNAAPKPKAAGDLDNYQLRQYGANSYRLVRGLRYLLGPDGEPLTLQVGR